MTQDEILYILVIICGILGISITVAILYLQWCKGVEIK